MKLITFLVYFTLTIFWFCAVTILLDPFKSLWLELIKLPNFIILMYAAATVVGIIGMWEKK